MTVTCEQNTIQTFPLPAGFELRCLRFPRLLPCPAAPERVGSLCCVAARKAAAGPHWSLQRSPPPIPHPWSLLHSPIPIPHPYPLPLSAVKGPTLPDPWPRGPNLPRRRRHQTVWRRRRQPTIDGVSGRDADGGACEASAGCTGEAPPGGAPAKRGPEAHQRRHAGEAAPRGGERRAMRQRRTGNGRCAGAASPSSLPCLSLLLAAPLQHLT